KELEAFKDVEMQTFVDLQERLRNQISSLEDETVKLAKQCLELLQQKGVELKSFSGSYFPKHLQGIVDRNFNNSNKKYYEPEDVRINKTAKDKALIESLIPDLLSVLKKIYRLFGTKYFYEAFLKNLVPLSLLNSISQEIDR